ncbi:MAG: amidohydrolase family protein [Bacteroidota bacterium]
MKTISSLLIALLLFSSAARSQNPAPVPAQTGSVLIMNVKAHLGNGKTIENAAIGFEGGKLTLVADATTIRLQQGAYKEIVDGGGRHAYPGLVACNTFLGLSEIDLVRSTRDESEVGEMNPNVRSIISYNTDSKIIPTVRSNGVLVAEVSPRGGMISGSSSVVQLDAWNWEDAAIKTDIGIHMNWPRMYVVQSGNPEQEENQRVRMQRELTALESFFSEAAAYCKQRTPVEKNVRFESMCGLFDGSSTLFVHCGYVKEIEAAVLFAKKYGIRMVLVGGTDAWRVTELLKQNNIAVVMGQTHALPPREDDDTDLPYKLPFLLHQAGVTCAISIDGSWQERNLPFMAGTAAAYGVPQEDAVAMITSVPAKLLGVSDRVGTLEVGKDATLLITSGDILDMRSSVVESAYIQGRHIVLDDVQKQLYRKYMDKYGLK